MSFDESLPIHSILESIESAIDRNQPVVVKAPPGAGKTTGVPAAIWRNCESALDGKQIWVIQPRRLAARSVADWLARNHGESTGQTFGYHVRFDRKESAATRVLLMTTGMFLRRMQTDPLLEKVGCVLFDEFHERTIELDVALALTTRLRTSLRDDLRLVVMSATLDPQPIVRYLSQSQSADDPHPVSLECEGRSYPIDLNYQPGDSRDRLEDRTALAVTSAISQTDGHVLVFLPGVAEIERTRRTLQSSGLDNGFDIHVLHGSLSPRQQDAALGESSGRRKIILSTNIAETSITVPGVTAVVDSGLAKTSINDSRLGLSRLETLPISQASADQRAGRAGRTGPGICIRLWSRAANASRTRYDAPEIQRGDLSAVVLLLSQLGETELDQIDWLDSPPRHAIDAAILLLRQLGAIDLSGRLTSVGGAMAAMPLPPRLSRFAIAASTSLKTSDVAIAAALLSERDPFDASERWTIAEKVRMIRDPNRSDSRWEPIRRSAKQIARSIETTGKFTGQKAETQTTQDERWARALLAAFPDRIVQRRSDDADRGRMVGGRGVRGLAVLDQTATPSPLMLCADIDGSGKESYARSGIPIDESWLADEAVSENAEADFQWDSESIRCRTVQRYFDLVLRQTPTTLQPNESTALCLYDAALNVLQDVDRWHRISPADNSDRESTVTAIIERIRRLQSHQPTSGFDIDATVRDVLMQLCLTRTSFAELRRAPWKDHLIGSIGYERWQIVERETPTSIVLPSGNRTMIHYASGKPPWIEAKIQDCFGWSATPRILFGRVPVQMHLLGPNRRPQQITEDLASFWANTYTEIRKQLRGRYPKHHWPEDPTTAQATHNGLKPR